MNTAEKSTVYFKEAGARPINTDTLLETVKRHIEKEEINEIVVASTTGKIGAEAVRLFQGYSVTVVVHSHGFKEPGKSKLDEELKKGILKAGAKLFVGTLR